VTAIEYDAELAAHHAFQLPTQPLQHDLPELASSHKQPDLAARERRAAPTYWM
jgi:hypothetical protein